MGYENLRLETRDGVAILTVNRPAKLNALDEGLERALPDGLEREAVLLGELVGTEGAREGTRAFLEKRAAQFKGR